MGITGFVTAPVFLRHDTGAGHPERAARLRAILERIGASGLAAELAFREASPAEPSWIEAVHAPEYVAGVRERIARGERVLDEGDTRVSEGSYEAALTGVGAALGAADRVALGEWQNAFVALRPPGHHALPTRAMGFCLFGNAAIAARYLQRRHGLARVAILDFDVHHGNGTQAAFERDPSVFFASLHQWPFYPGSGAADERGLGEGEGTTLNCPMPAGSGDADYLRRMEAEVLPALEEFAPQLLILSAGFDAHERDPLAGTKVSSAGFREITRLATGLAARHCRGRILSLLEGGYDLEALADSVLAHVEELRAAAR